MAKKLDKRLADLGGNAIIERGLGDDQHPSGYVTHFLCNSLPNMLTEILCKICCSRSISQIGKIKKVFCFVLTLLCRYEGALDPWLSSLWTTLYNENPQLFPKGLDFSVSDLKILDQPNVDITYLDSHEIYSQSLPETETGKQTL